MNLDKDSLYLIDNCVDRTELILAIKLSGISKNNLFALDLDNSRRDFIPKENYLQSLFIGKPIVLEDGRKFGFYFKDQLSFVRVKVVSAPRQCLNLKCKGETFISLTNNRDENRSYVCNSILSEQSEDDISCLLYTVAYPELKLVTKDLCLRYSCITPFYEDEVKERNLKRIKINDSNLSQAR